MNFKICILASLLCALPFKAAAQGGEAMTFATFPHSAATEAQAGAGALLSGSAWSAFANPAAGLYSRGGAAASIDSKNASSYLYTNAAAVVKLGKRISVQAGFSKGFGKEYDVYTSPGKPSGTFTPSQMTAGFGAGFLLTEAIGIGANVRIAQETLAPEVAHQATSADVAVSYCRGIIAASAGVYSLGSSIYYGNTEFKLPTAAVLDASIAALNTEAIKLNASLMARYNLSGAAGIALGAEFGIKDMVFARAGYLVAGEGYYIPSHLSAGLGLKFKKITADFAFLTASGTPLDGSFTAGLGIAF
ncbi:MAG: hypothetical protein KBS55_06090 [Bacteroidales bacterium]|nr:hypothetical protein [Candidatus Cryptobacteroides aphodequi]